ncbi:DeoR/GlpR family DNA-binding transcription regulator [uncultured Thalassospira sp.]|jgi:DeoR family glycerol-3-phosphate regulon repressor|uniref:DeoR/GlpR family DNA-binding transcription regulator n=1 Tax=uncultured Thalassospira sp. TaxID=404382 RepID=UPI0030D9C334|tara:strand:+ start:367 stop:1104 length:738 start_codon:yes stop_codon:yes gene_type:complete
MFSLSDRQQEVLARIEAKGFITLEALADMFSVSMQTVRRDVIAMHEAGLIERFHGGAGAKGGVLVDRMDHGQKRMIGRSEKRSIAEHVASLVPDGAFVYIDVGTTMEAAAEMLALKPALYVVTNSLHVAAAFDPTRHDVRILPGRLSGPDGSITGEETVLALRALRPDFALVSCSAIEPGGSVMDFDPGKIAVKRMAMSVARKSFLLAITGKFGRTARVEIADRADFSAIITEETGGNPVADRAE